jgi:hypothetical protein
MNDIEQAVTWFNEQYETRISNQPTKRYRQAMNSVIWGLHDDPNLEMERTTVQTVECVDINIPRDNLVRLITKLWYFERYQDHPAVKQAFDQYLMLVHLTHRENQ